MSQLRNLLRAYAIDHVDPPEVLRHTAGALAHLLPDALATVFYAAVDLGTGELSYANAGHPPPVCGHPDGPAEYLDDAAGVMLGAPSGGVLTGGSRRARPGGTPLLYTDGLIEGRRRDITEGLTALGRAMGRAGPRSAEQTCAAVQQALLRTSQRADDICLLAARLTA